MIRNLFLFYFINFEKLKPVVLIAIYVKVQPNVLNVLVLSMFMKKIVLIVVQLDIMKIQLVPLSLVLVIITEHLLTYFFVSSLI